MNYDEMREMDDLAERDLRKEQKIVRLQKKLAAAQAEIERLKSPWVAVEDRLPEWAFGGGKFNQAAPRKYTDDYLVLDTYGEKHVAFFNSVDGWLVDAGQQMHCVDGVTHWMQLPAPPQEEK